MYYTAVPVTPKNDNNAHSADVHKDPKPSSNIRKDCQLRTAKRKPSTPPSFNTHIHQSIIRITHSLKAHPLRWAMTTAAAHAPVAIRSFASSGS